MITSDSGRHAMVMYSIQEDIENSAGAIVVARA
jgi:hypothetical protein